MTMKRYWSFRPQMIKDQSKGIICIIIAAAGFSLMTLFVRLAGDIPTMQKAFFRNAFALVIAVATLIIKKEKFRIEKDYGADVFFRCLFGTTGLIANFYAIDSLALADANMLNKLSPFFAILISVPLLKEKPDKTDIAATVIAFTGALFIIRPVPGNMEFIPSLIGLYGGFGAGTAYVFVRRAGKKGASTPVIVICFSLFSCLLSLPFILFNYVHMSPKQLGCLVLAGLSAAAAQFAITNAYKFAPASKLSVFDYLQVIFAAFWAMLIFKETPTVMSIIGYIIIIGVAFIRWKKAQRGGHDANHRKVLKEG
ncbi:MAG: DMT family transporter [Lachnospiraceae bacterium]|nr:DMT family transporter [Lachnospiraceae bacterium]